MKNKLMILPALCALGLPVVANAQATGSPARGDTTNTTYREDRMNERYGDWSGFTGPRAGEWEFTLGGSGLSNKDMDNSSGGVGASLGLYMTDTLLLSVRQTVNYANPSSGDAGYIGSTRVALDQHVLLSDSGRLRPFVGVNFGGVYGDNVTNTFVAGIEAGLKFYVQERTFLYGLADYAWSFRNSDDADENFNDGGFQWSVGVGFNF
jgi:hypothetical protein